jgi:chromosome segregation ATPase
MSARDAFDDTVATVDSDNKFAAYNVALRILDNQRGENVTIEREDLRGLLETIENLRNCGVEALEDVEGRLDDAQAQRDDYEDQVTKLQDAIAKLDKALNAKTASRA